MPDRGGQGQQPLGGAGGDAGAAVSAVQFWATVDEEGSFVLQSGDRFRKADAAGAAVLDRRCRGMTLWHVDIPDGPRSSPADLRRRTLGR